MRREDDEAAESRWHSRVAVHARPEVNAADRDAERVAGQFTQR